MEPERISSEEANTSYKVIYCVASLDPQITQINADYKKQEKRYKTRVVGGTSRSQKSDVRGQKGKQRFQARMVGGKVSEDLFDRGLCLPSGTAMTNGDLDRVIETIRRFRD